MSFSALWMETQREEAHENNNEPAGFRLLGAVSLGGDEASSMGVSACVVDQTGQKQVFRSIRLPELVRLLWPGQLPEGRCRRLRLIADHTQEDFVLKATDRETLIRTAVVRALIEPTRIVFVRVDSAVFQSFLEEMLHELAVQTEKHSFNVWATECVIFSALSLHTMRFQLLKPVAGHILDKLRLENSSEALLQLYPVKASVTEQIEKIRPIVQKLNGVERWEEWSQVRGRFEEKPVGQSEELEDALEFLAHNAEELLGDVTEMETNIEDAMLFCEASLNCGRNRLLQWDVYIIIWSVSISVGAVISGIFGMNLVFGFENVEGGWQVCTAVITVLGVSICTVGARVVRKSRTHYARRSARYGNNKFFSRIGQDDYVLSLVHEPHNDLDDLAVQKVQQHLRESEIPVQRLTKRSGRIVPRI